MALSNSGKAKAVVAVLIGLALLIFIAFNFEQVVVNFLVAKVQMNLALLMIGSAMAGFLIGWLVKSFFWIKEKRR